MCLALSNNCALQAMNLFWDMPLSRLFAFAHAYMQNNGIETKPLKSAGLLSTIFKKTDNTDDDKNESQNEWFDQNLNEVEYVRQE